MWQATMSVRKRRQPTHSCTCNRCEDEQRLFLLLITVSALRVHIVANWLTHDQKGSSTLAPWSCTQSVCRHLPHGAVHSLML